MWLHYTLGPLQVAIFFLLATLNSVNILNTLVQLATNCTHREIQEIFSTCEIK